MEEFRIADEKAMEEKGNFIILILKDKIPTKDLPKPLKKYMRTFTYIDGTKNVEEIVNRLRYSILLLARKIG